MVRIRRWVLRKRGKVVWSEPQMPPFVKINPNGVNPEMGLQPGDISMAMAAMEFLDQEEDEDLAELPAQLLSCFLMMSRADLMFSTEFA
jgi:hypothetical protein